jgi:hypothetical protein
MGETNKDNYLSPDRLKLLWLLLEKRGIDFLPQKIYNSECATDVVTMESGEESMESDGAHVRRKTHSLNQIGET